MPQLTNLERIYQLKSLAVILGLLFFGLLVDVLGNLLQQHNSNHLLVSAANGMADFLFVSGGLGAAIGFFTDRDKDAASTDRNRRVLKELIPDFTDAVVHGFAVQPDDLKRVATPELLDHLATNALALRLGDEQFAAELYADVRDQAIRAPERWYDVDVSVRLSSLDESSTKGAALLAVLVTWEYTTTPKDAARRFACTSDMDEFHELVHDIPTTSTWFMTPRPGLDATQPSSFELLTFSVDGQDRRIRRSARKAGQVYSVNLGDDIVDTGLPVRIRHTYRAVTDPSNHRLFLAIAQPSRNVSVEVDYSDSDLTRMSVTDLVPSSRRPYVSQLPAQATGKELTIEVPGWLQAGTGFTFVWTSASEEPTAAPPRRPAPPAAAA